MFRWRAEKVRVRTDTYWKFGFVLTECEFFDCPRCGRVLNAGAYHHPAYCEHCGQKLSFKGIAFKPERSLGYRREGTGTDEQSEQNRMV